MLGQRGPQLELEAARLALEVLAHDAADLLERGARRAAVLARLLDPGLDLVVQTGHTDHEELVEVGGDDRAELRPLEQRHALVLRQFEHAGVELQPGELAVEVEVGGGEVDLGGDRLGAAHDGDCDRSARGALFKVPCHVQQQALAEPAASDLQRPSQALGGRAEDQDAGREEPDAEGVERELGGDLVARGAAEDVERPVERASIERVADEPAQRGGAAADRHRRVGGRDVARGQHVEGVLAHRLQLGRGRRVRAQVALGQRARADEERRAPVDPARDRADGDLGRPSADVDDGDDARQLLAERLRGAEEGQPRLLVAVEDLDLLAHARQELVAVDGGADAGRGHHPHALGAGRGREPDLLGHDVRDLLDLRRGDLGRRADAREDALLQHLAEAPVHHVGDEHASRVRADIHAGAHHRLQAILP